MLPGPDDEGEDEDEDEDEDYEPRDTGWDDEDSNEPQEAVWLGVLDENRIVIDAFSRCRVDVSLGGMGGAYWQGISASEVRSACELGRVPRYDWPRVADGVQLMGRITAALRNKQEADAAKKRKT